MIKITYDYICDICRNQTDETQVFTINPFESSADPKPIMRNAVGPYHVCDECMADAKDVLMEKFHKNRRG